MANLTASVGSYESGAVNSATDVRLIQTLLTEVCKKLNNSAFDPKGIDGKISRTASRSNTVTAITKFQLQQAGFANADQRVDVNGKTWNKLVTLAGSVAVAPPAQPVAGTITLTISHGGRIPTATKFENSTPATANSMYESTFQLSGGLIGTFRGSIYPDDMTVKGRVIDGQYPLHIGFHQGGSAVKQEAKELVVKTQDVRAGLLVNARNSVPVKSDKPSKTTSDGINVHNGFNGKRYSDGCLTLMPSDWSRFIRTILNAYPNINDWHTLGNNTGKRIGMLVVRA